VQTESPSRAMLLRGGWISGRVLMPADGDLLLLLLQWSELRGGGCFVDDLPIKGLGAGGGCIWGGAALPLVQPWWRGSSVAWRWMRCASSLADRGGEVGRLCSASSSSGSATGRRSKWGGSFFLPQLELASMVVAVSAKVGKTTTHGSLLLELFPGGLSATCFIIPPGCMAVGQLLHHYIDSFHRQPLLAVSKWLIPGGGVAGQDWRRHRSEGRGGVWT
jgi:hypothetical protein